MAERKRKVGRPKKVAAKSDDSSVDDVERVPQVQQPKSELMFVQVVGEPTLRYAVGESTIAPFSTMGAESWRVEKITTSPGGVVTTVLMSDGSKVILRNCPVVEFWRVPPERVPLSDDEITTLARYVVMLRQDSPRSERIKQRMVPLYARAKNAGQVEDVNARVASLMPEQGEEQNQQAHRQSPGQVETEPQESVPVAVNERGPDIQDGPSGPDAPPPGWHEGSDDVVMGPSEFNASIDRLTAKADEL